jgi:sec-independent protein translocase protein TatC
MTLSPEEQTMTFWEHLDELRKRVFRVVLALLVGTVVAWIFRVRLLGWVTTPFAHAWHDAGLQGSGALHFQAPAALFLAYVKLAFLAGSVVALPVVLYQIWAFVAPGLYARERYLALPFVASSTGLFAFGAWFGFRFAFPLAFQFLLGLSGQLGGGFQVLPTVMIDDYLDFVMRMLLGFGVVFELPVLVFFLSMAGIITHRHLIRFARYFIVIAFVIAAIVTPPDPASQLLMAVPLCLLYFVSIGVAWLVGRSKGKSTSSATPT